MNTLFKHKIKNVNGGITVAMEELPIWLVNELEVGNTLEKRIGIAKCSDSDRFVKSTGRELASSRMKLKKLTVKDTLLLNNSRRIVLEDSNNNTFHLIHYRNTGSVFFMDFFEGSND